MTEKILLALLPYWTPLIPPMGISCLKSCLAARGFDVKTVDANVDPRFQQIMDRYFDHLKEFVPPAKQGNIHNIANEVLRHHMMAHLNYQDKSRYAALVKELVSKTFFTALQDDQAQRLTDIMETFYTRLEEYVLALLEKEKPTVLGLSTYTVTLPASLFTFKLAKKIYPHIKTVMGGGIFSGELDTRSDNFRYFLEQTPYIDAIIVGEGERLLLEYLQGKLPADRRVYTLADINGETMDLSTAPAPDFSDMDTRFYPNLAAYTSRSCPFNCSFCSEKVMWGKYRKKTGPQMAEELRQLSERHKTQLFLMSDSLLNPVTDSLSKALIDAGLSIYWDGYLRADPAACNTDNTFQWRKGGFYRARLGLESGSPRILEAMGKKITPRQIKDAVASLAYAGIKTTTYWVIGYPGETEEDFQHTLDLIEDMKDDLYEADCNPFIYYPSGQVQSDKWAGENKSRLLYAEDTRDMLMLQNWALDTPPSREVTFQRLNRFVTHCKNLGVANPYTLRDIHKADERWQKLHTNAVPPLADFLDAKSKGVIAIDENKRVKKVVFSRNVPQIDGDWGF
jgi:radical SAM superfamily enzyme YgiQ (UPF0313 family)